MNKASKVVIMYLLWDQEPKRYLPDAIEGVKKQTLDHDRIEFLIVYNSHKPEHSSQAEYIESELDKHKQDLPHVTFLNQSENLGFSGGNNVGMKWAIDHDFDYVYLHNGDGILHERCMEELVDVLDKDTTIGVAQSMMLLHPETDLINTSGNEFHYLGFGYGRDYRKVFDPQNYKRVFDIGYASGGAIMMRTELLEKYGLWEHDYFMYHEDTDYSLRLKMMGKRIVTVSTSLFYHKYAFTKSIAKYFWMERNRYTILFVFYKIPTLILLLPILLPLELGLLLFSVKGGWWKEKLNVYKYWLNYKNWKTWKPKRAYIQKHRTVSDRALLKGAATGIYFQEEAVESPLVDYVANPVMKVYHWILMRLVWW